MLGLAATLCVAGFPGCRVHGHEGSFDRCAAVKVVEARVFVSSHALMMILWGKSDKKTGNTSNTNS